MSSPDAEGRFMEAVHAYRAADEKARKDPLRGVDKKAFRLVLVDLEAVIPGLSGAMLGRAYGLTASCYYWLRTAELFEESKTKSLFDLEAARKSPTRKAGIAAARKALGILAKVPGEDVAWLEDLVKRLE